MRYEVRENLLRQMSIGADRVSGEIFMFEVLLLCLAAIGL